MYMEQVESHTDECDSAVLAAEQAHEDAELIAAKLTQVVSKLDVMILGQEATNNALTAISTALVNLASAVAAFKMPSLFGGGANPK